MSRKSKLDQYYTNPDYALECFKSVEKLGFTGEYVEPCAGTGSFFNLMPSGSVGMDLDPKIDVPKQDFLTYKGEHKGAIVVSNPPFGFQAKLAIQFFNKCADMGADVIAFIVPKSFRKASVSNKLDTSFHLIQDTDSPKNSFILDGEAYDVPCCFQVWVRKPKPRKLIDTTAYSEHIVFVTKEDADLAVRRAGSKAGELIDIPEGNPDGIYYIKCLSPVSEVIKGINAIDLSYERNNTAGVRSIAKYELVNKLNGVM